MALVHCPECGKEKVSDLAEACPECGFPIKSYYENKKKSDLRTETETPNNTEEKNTSENTIEEKNESGRASIKNHLIETKEDYKPEKPTLLSVAFDDIVYGVLGIITFSIFAWFFHDISESLSMVFMFLATGFGVGYTISAFSHLSQATEEYNDKLKRWEEDPAKFFVQELNRQAKEWKEKQKNMENTVLQSGRTVCPKCGGTSFTPVRKKWDIVTGYRTNKIELICDNCGNRIGERK